MGSKFFALLTERGAVKLAAATALGNQVKITHMAVGDGNGALPTPTASQTALVNEKRRAVLNSLTIDPVNPSQIIAEQVIPEADGGFWIREVGIYDDAGDLIAIANCAETYKPVLAEGSGRTQVIRMVLIVSSTSAVTLKIDPSVVLATRKYVDDKAIEIKVYVDDLMAKHLAALDPHTQYAPKASPTFTGSPKAPTPPTNSSSTQLATTAFVQAVIAQLVASSPASLDTLNELAAALGNDPNFATTITNTLSLKAPLASPALTGVPTAPTAGATINTTQIATTAFVKTAIANLVASAPGALDTLNELAAALGNDASFATTMTNALALKATLASPIFTGAPKAPTAAAGTNTTQLATTEFVQTATAASWTDRGQLATDANLNTMNPVATEGEWSKSSSTGLTTENGFPVGASVGTLKVNNGGRFQGQQTYTGYSGDQWVRSLTAAWNGVNGPWSDWFNTATKSLRSAVVTGSETDLNTYTAADQYGTYRVASSSAATAALGWPYDNFAGTVEVVQGYGSGAQQIALSTSGNMLTRYWNGSGTTIDRWSAWVEVGSRTRATFINDDLNNAVESGIYSVSYLAGTSFNFPGNIGGVMRVTQRGNTPATIVQEFIPVVGSGTFAGRKFFRTLAGGTWTAWSEDGIYPLRALGIGGNAGIPTASSFDFQTEVIEAGATYRISVDNISNMPAGVSYASGTGVFIVIDGTSDSGNRFSAEIIPDTATNTNYKIFKVLSVGPAGSRTFSVRQIFTNTDIVPVANGGTGATTNVGALNALGAAPLASPTLTGIPTAPTAAATVNTTQIATTAFVKTAIANLVASAPGALDTLNELAAALGNDASFATTMTNALAGKQPLDSTLTNLSGKTVAEILQYLGLGTLSNSVFPSRITLPGGWKIMFGIATASSTVGAAKLVTFPESFSIAAAPVLVVTPNNASNTATQAWYDNQTTTGFNLRCSAAVSCTWIAIG